MKKLLAILLIIFTLFSTTIFAQESNDYTTKTNIIYSGQKNNHLNDIYIKESGAGLFQKGKNIYLDFDGLSIDATQAIFKVVQGDLKIKSTSTSNDTLHFEITRESTTPSIIQISSVQVSVPNNMPLGNYPLQLIMENSSNYPNNMFDDKKTSSIKLMENFITVNQVKDPQVVPFNKEITGKIGSHQISIQNKAEVYTLEMPTEIYLSPENRVMVPIHSFATAFNESCQLHYNHETKQIGLSYEQYTVSMTIGSNIMKINGVDTLMTEKTVLHNGYTYVPLRDLSFILGIKDDMIHYNNLTKTVTLIQNSFYPLK